MNAPQLKQLAAFTSGIVVPMDAVPDPVFAGRMMGDGIAIDPTDRVLFAPCDGKILQLHASRHACILEADNGARILLHIGIDTVLLKGKGFTARVAQGDCVHKGQALIEFDPAVLKQHGKPAITILAIENSDSFQILWQRDCRDITAGSNLLTIAPASRLAPPPVNPAGTSEVASGWAVISHAGGLHARPCALLANAIKPFSATMEIRVRGKSANARSATAVMALAIAEGDEVEISASGVHAGDALEAAIVALTTPSTATHAAPVNSPVQSAASSLQANQLAGVVAAPGLAMGKAARLEHSLGPIKEQGEGQIQEQRALLASIQAVTADIEAAINQAKSRNLSEQAEIFSAHRALLEDPELFTNAQLLIAAGKSAAFAWHQAIDTQCQALKATASALLAGRVSDLRDLERQVLRKLSGDSAPVNTLPPQAILLADDLVPSDFALIEQAGVAAIVTAQGGPTSHIAILARAHGIPSLVAVGPRLASIKTNSTVIVDADRGLLEIDPDQERISATQKDLIQRSHARAQSLASAHQKAITTDGTGIEVAANIATAKDALESVKLGAESVGLLRTELLFMDRETAPTQEEQRQCYQAILDAMAGRSVIIRTLDVGADKSLPYISMPAEENPALGQRGIRLGLARQALLAEQLRAILSLSPLSSVKIMLPMVTDLAEITATRTLLDQLSTELGIREKVSLGIMIETPSAALLADQLAKDADFFSVGTNDLTQYTLCMDRTNPALAAQLDGLHPAVLRLIAHAANGANRRGKWLGVCGAMASDPIAVPLLIGLGVTELSASPAVIPEIKAIVRRLSQAECRTAALAALHLTCAQDVRAHIRKTWPWLDHASS